MKRIVKEGNFEDRFAICPWCGCQFTFNITDIDECGFSCELRCPYCDLVIDNYLGASRKDLFNNHTIYIRHREENK